MGEEAQVKEAEIVVSPETMRLIERAKRRLAKEERFSWIEHLSTGDFLNFFFGLSEVSSYCRSVFFKILEEEAEEERELIVGCGEAPHKSAEKSNSRGEDAATAIIKALKKGPLTTKEISDITNLSYESVRWRLRKLMEKGIVKKEMPGVWSLAKQPPT